MKANANNLPLRDNFVDCVFTFNAIHHFHFPRFLENAARIIRRDGLIFIYTRLQSQNETSLWGRYFPHFLEREGRLYELSEITRGIDLTNCLSIECIESFQFSRKATLDEVLEKSDFITLAQVILLSGFGLKAAIIPFHAWLPDAHSSAPSPISSMLSGVLIKAIGVYVILRLFFNMFIIDKIRKF